MRTIAIGLLAAVAATAAGAGEVNLQWDASAGAAGYNVWVGTAPGVYGPTPATTGPATTQQALGLEDGCVPHYAVVTAFNAAGESDFSLEVAFVPRPIVTAATPPFEDPPPAELVVAGDNFAPGATVEIDGVPTTPTSASCGELRFAYQDWAAIAICNGPVCGLHALGPPPPPDALEVH